MGVCLAPPGYPVPVAEWRAGGQVSDRRVAYDRIADLILRSPDLSVLWRETSGPI